MLPFRTRPFGSPTRQRLRPLAVMLKGAKCDETLEVCRCAAQMVLAVMFVRLTMTAQFLSPSCKSSKRARSRHICHIDTCAVFDFDSRSLSSCASYAPKRDKTTSPRPSDLHGPLQNYPSRVFRAPRQPHLMLHLGSMRELAKRHCA